MNRAGGCNRAAHEERMCDGGRLMIGASLDMISPQSCSATKELNIADHCHQSCQDGVNSQNKRILGILRHLCVTRENSTLRDSK